jgi:hypothetical protein
VAKTAAVVDRATITKTIVSVIEVTFEAGNGAMVKFLVLSADVV